HGGLKFGETGWAALHGEVPFVFRAKERSAGRRGGLRNDAATGPAGSLANDPLFQALRALRSELAREQNVPPYVIFHDATLMEMVRRKPADLTAMSRVPGVGRRKLDRYGAIFVAAIAKLVT
ncbi:MAG: HRDC domain-containing protein, partial [Hyphomicrobiales bacterium]|nr:HRDC domain-containing protein [Hyphomicrobiales bacterium]